MGLFKIKSEGAVAAGVRRVEAICGKQAEDYINEQFNLLSNLGEALKNPKDIALSWDYNFGAQHAEGDYLLNMQQDCLPEHLCSRLRAGNQSMLGQEWMPLWFAAT